MIAGPNPPLPSDARSPRCYRRLAAVRRASAFFKPFNCLSWRTLPTRAALTR
jgi:hypothetical protein